MNSAAQLAGVERRLSSKLSFESAVADLHLYVMTTFTRGELQASLPGVYKLLVKVLRLLRSRYTSVLFWQAGLKLFVACQAVITDTQTAELLQKAADECREFISSCYPAERQTSSGFLFEGQLSSSREQDEHRAGVATQARPSQMDLAGVAHTHMTDTQTRDELEAGLIAALSQAGMLSDTANPLHRPPASKRAVKALRTIVLKADSLKDLGGEGACCSVCREDFIVDESVNVMPCSSSHAFHTACLRPWLQENNSCPVCRYELESTDPKYDAMREWNRQEAEERKSAANAQTHNDFLFL